MIKITKTGEKYKCAVCTNIVSVVQEGIGTLVCCDQPMQVVVEQQATPQQTPPTQEQQLNTEPQTEVQPGTTEEVTPKQGDNTGNV